MATQNKPKLRDVYITGTGSFSPGEPVPYDKIEDVLGRLTRAPAKLQKRIDRIRPLMRNILGVEYSHYAWDPIAKTTTETNTSMSAKAARPALERAGLDPKEVDLLVYAGVFYDYMCPPTSVFVQEALGIPRCAEIAIHSNCTSIYKALQVAADLVAGGRYENALVVAAQLSSPFLQADYFNQDLITEEQAILRWFLSDGAGALVVSATPPAKPCLRVVNTYIESVGPGIPPTMHMMIGCARSNLMEIYQNGWHHLTQDLKAVSELAIKLGTPAFQRTVADWNMDLSRVKCFFLNVPTRHMMNLAAKGIRELLGRPDLPFYTKLSTRGYPGAPAVAIAMDEYLRDEATALKPGDQIMSFVTESSKWMHAAFLLEQTGGAGA